MALFQLNLSQPPTGTLPAADTYFKTFAYTHVSSANIPVTIKQANLSVIQASYNCHHSKSLHFSLRE